MEEMSEKDTSHDFSDETVNGYQESILEIAKAIHQDYNDNRLREKPGVPLEYPDWDTLPDDLKHSNIDQAMSYPEKLKAIGCHMGTEGIAVREFTAEELEIMSIMEHDRWVKDRAASGWVFGEIKDVQKRTSPYMVPWERLEEDIREYDREAVRNMIAVLDRIGIKVIRD